VIEDTEKKVPQTYKGTELRNHYYRYSQYIIISSNHELLAFSILLLLIIGSSSLLNMALSKSSSHFPLLTTDGISVNGEAGPSNINRAYNLAHGPSNYVSSGNTSGAVNNKVVMIGFDDGWTPRVDRVEYCICMFIEQQMIVSEMGTI